MEGQVTNDKTLLLTRRLWNAGLTLSEACKDRRVTQEMVPSVIKEWRRLKRLFRCRSLPGPYLHSYRERPLSKEEQDRINSAGCTAKMYGSTYGNWSGNTGPGKRLREMLRNQ